MKKKMIEKSKKLTLGKKTITTLTNNQMKYINGAIHQAAETMDLAGCTGRPTKTR